MSSENPRYRLLSLTGFMREFSTQHKTRRNRPFCWILGAGASVRSGIPTAGDLARDFLHELCIHARGSENHFEDWIAKGGPNIAGLNATNPAPHYPEIYQARYGDCPDAGHAFLEEAMRDKTPSYGYAVLAWLLANTDHKIVITPNFDNLVADALSAYTATFPRIVGHAELAEFVQTELRRPLIAKIHGDLGFRVQNTPAEIAKLDERWQKALVQVFTRCTPIVIGYGGNDKTLMSILRALPEGVPDRIYWCQFQGGDPSPDVSEFLSAKRGASLVVHPGFDELMMILEDHLRTNNVAAIPNLENELCQRQQQRLALFQKQRVELGEAVTRTVQSVESEGGGAAKNETKTSLSTAASRVLGGTKRTQQAWQWVLRANAETNAQKKEEIFKAAIAEFPQSADLHLNYARFIKETRGDSEESGAHLQRAVEAEPNNAMALDFYARFLDRFKRDRAQAEKFHKKAIKADPKNAFVIGTYAIFCKNHRLVDEAEELFKKALSLDPNYAFNLGNYALFLWQQKNDMDQSEEFFKRAIQKNPNYAYHLGNYASFLRLARKRPDQAEIFHKRAISADPKDVYQLREYAKFLREERGDLKQAALLEKRASDAERKS